MYQKIHKTPINISLNVYSTGKQIVKRIKKYHCPCSGNISHEVRNLTFSNSNLFYKSCKIKYLRYAIPLFHSFPVHNTTTGLFGIGREGKASVITDTKPCTSTAPLFLDQGRALSCSNMAFCPTLTMLRATNDNPN